MFLYILGFFSAAALLAVTGYFVMGRLGRFFFVSDVSCFDFDETVKRIRAGLNKDKNWIIRGEKNFNDAYRESGQGELPHRLTEFKAGNPEHSFKVNRVSPEVSTFMPAAIAVVGYSDGRVMIYRKNTALMGRMFKEPIRNIMAGEVPDQLNRILDGIVE